MKNIFTSLGGLVATVTLATIGLWIAGYHVAAAILGAFTVAMWLLLVILLSTALGSWWTLKVEDKAVGRMKDVINQNDAWDAKKTVAYTTLVKEGIRLGASNAPRPGGDLPALPPPSQAGGWLPPLEAIPPLEMEGDYIEGELSE